MIIILCECITCSVRVNIGGVNGDIVCICYDVGVRIGRGGKVGHVGVEENGRDD